MPQLYIRDINLQNMESLQSLEYSRNLHKDLRAVVIDKLEIMEHQENICLMRT